MKSHLLTMLLLGLGLIVSITKTVAQTGETCEMAIIATSGINTTKATSNNLVYYKYITTKAGKFEISSCLPNTTQDTHLYIYSSCGVQSNNNDDFGGDQSKLTFDVVKGTTILFAWRVYGTPSSFDWSITETEWQPGELCGKAIPVTQGTVTTMHTSVGHMWYEYNATQNGKITVNGIDDSNPEANWAFFKNSCNSANLTNSINYRNNQVHKAIPCNAGDKYIVYWVYDDQTKPYNWTIKESPLEPGDLCMNALTATAGVNNLPNGAPDYKWFQFTATRYGKLEVSSTGNSTGTSSLLWATNCTDLPSEKGIVDINGHKNLVINAVQGTTYLFSWNTTLKNFNFTISESDWLPGEDCSTAQLLTGNGTVQGIAQMPKNRPHWYKFKANNNFIIEIESCNQNGTDFTNIEMFENCESTEPLGNSMSCGIGTKVAAPMQKDEYVIFSVTNTSSSNPSKFILKERNALDGQACFQPKAAVLGANSVPDNIQRLDQWFSYSAKYNGEIILSTCEFANNFDTRVSVFASCDMGITPIATNNDACGKLSKLEFPCTAGVQYLIKWHGATVSQSYNFTLTETGKPTSVDTTDTEIPVIYPNPNNGSFRIQCKLPIALIKVYTLDGRLVTETTETSETTLNKNIAPGLYIVELEMVSGKSIRRKIRIIP